MDDLVPVSSVSSLHLDRQRDREGQEKVRFISDLSALELLIAKQLAIYRLGTILRQEYTLEQLNTLLKVHKSGDLLSKIVGMVKKRKKADHACFGQPLILAVDRTGVDSTRGSSTGTLRIPRVVDECLSHLEANGGFFFFFFLSSSFFLLLL